MRSEFVKAMRKKQKEEERVGFVAKSPDFYKLKEVLDSVEVMARLIDEVQIERDGTFALSLRFKQNEKGVRQSYFFSSNFSAVYLGPNISFQRFTKDNRGEFIFYPKYEPENVNKIIQNDKFNFKMYEQFDFFGKRYFKIYISGLSKILQKGLLSELFGAAIDDVLQEEV